MRYQDKGVFIIVQIPFQPFDMFCVQIVEMCIRDSLMPDEEAAFYDLIALYHFALQATIVEVFGMDCVDNEFFDCQLEWLYQWREQCEKYKQN